MGTPFFSVVIPMYNAGSFIRKTLESVLQQEFQDFEIVVVDDGSTDDSAAVVKTVDDPRIRLIQKENTGVSDSRNVGCQVAIGVYVASLDSDDYWYPFYLSEAAKFFSENPEIDWYGSAMESLMSGEMPRAIPTQEPVFTVRHFFSTGKRYIHSSNLIYKRELWMSSGGYPTGMAYFEDWCFQAKIAAQRPLVGTNSRVGAIYYRARQGSATMKAPVNLCEAYRESLLIIQDAVARSKTKVPLWAWSTARLYFRNALHVMSRDRLMSCVQELQQLNGRARTIRWCRFIRLAYALADERHREGCRGLLACSFKQRAIRSFKSWRLFLYFVAYTVRGLCDYVQDCVEFWVKGCEE